MIRKCSHKTNGKKVLDEVLKDLTLRAETGKEKYGTYLRTDNGRDAMVDCYQEILDAAMYIKQKLMEEGEVSPYRSWDFCKSIQCSGVVGSHWECKNGCKAYAFHQYLKQNGQIREEG